MKLETLLFGDYSKREIKKIEPIANKVEELADKYSNMSEEELRRTSNVLRARLAEGETLNDILPDAFAAVRETADRILGKRPFHVQILGGILLHQGRISEMKTGEGKTLVATMPAYLNALTGNGVHVVTVNDYLAKRDAAEMGRVYEYLGLKTGVVYSDMDFDKKKYSYACDITYGTGNEFGFDYLRDNIAKSEEMTYQRGHNFCIIDEIDSILIDEARNPLIISGVGNDISDVYEKCSQVVRGMSKKVVEEMDSKEELDNETVDYVVEEKSKHVVLTPKGAQKVEKHFGIENLNDAQNTVILHNVNMAIRAYGAMQRDVDYIIDGDSIVIVDQNTGRLSYGRRFQDGLHQAIEAKEGVKIKGESHIVATITLQNFFRMYKKLSGMTGTAKTEEDEFRQVYGLDVVEVPTNRPMIRVDNPDRFFLTEDQKFAAIVKQVEDCHRRGQPVLIGTASVEKSEKLAKFLKAAGLKFRLLNAKVSIKEYERDATAASAAGRPGEIIVATNMAGRGTDIMLGGNAEFQAKEWIRSLVKKEQKDKKGDNRVSNYFNSILGNEEEWVALVASNTPIDECFKRYIESDRKLLQKKLSEHRTEYKSKFEQFKKVFETDRNMVVEAGGLCVIGSERHESRRIDNQLRGRAGRQGDPGASTFYVSMEDDIIRLFGDHRIEPFKKMLTNIVDEKDGGELMQNMKMFSDVMEKAQKNVEAGHFKSRKNVLQYDDILNEQRKYIFTLREEILKDADISDKIINMIGSTVEDTVAEYTSFPQGAKYPVVDIDGLERTYSYCQLSLEEMENKSPKEITEYITEKAMLLYRAREAQCSMNFLQEAENLCESLCSTLCEEKCDTRHEHHCESFCEKICPAIRTERTKKLCEKLLGEMCDAQNKPCENMHEGVCEKLRDKIGELSRGELCAILSSVEGSMLMRNYERRCLLDNMDALWLDHIDAIDALKESISLQAYAQKDPLKEYKIIGSSMFADLINDIRQNTVRMILTSAIQVVVRKDSAAKNLRVGGSRGKSRGTVRNSATKIKPNDPCPCGSNKKYKKCCGAGGGN